LGLTNGTTYYYVVTAVNARGESAPSPKVSATPTANPTLEPPTGVTATSGDGEVTVSWSAATGAVSYNVYYSTDGENGTEAPAGAGTSFTVSPLVDGMTYYFVVTSVDANGDESEASAQVSATPGPPEAPTGVAAYPGNAQVTVTWNGVTGASSYDV